MRASDSSGSPGRGARVLITGANGFLGAHLAEHLARLGYPLVLAARSPDSYWRGYVPTFPDGADIRWAYVGDMGPETDWRPVLRDVGTVVHLAGRAHVHHGTDEAALHRRITIDATVGLARAAQLAGLDRFFYVSSIGAVTSGTDELVGSRTVPAPRTVYGRAKLAAEAALAEIAGKEGMETTIIRPPLLYGPGQPGNMARLFNIVRRGLPLPLGAVRNRRSFLYVGNFTDLVSHLMGLPRLPPVVIPADREHWSTPALIEAIAIGQGKSARLLPVPLSWLRLAMRLRRLQGLAPLVDSLAVDVDGLTLDTGWRAPHSGADALARTALAPNRSGAPITVGRTP
jgi:nucleoside-diphosphate-sugar epimerase